MEASSWTTVVAQMAHRKQYMSELMELESE